MKKALALILSVLMLMALLAGCGDSKPADTAAPDTDTPAASGDSSAPAATTDGAKILKFGCQMYSDGMVDPAAQTNGAWNAMRYGITECLFKFDDSMVPQPWLAEKAEPNEDSSVWTVTLKSGIKFSDGCDMTATKVKDSFDRLLAEGPNGSSAPDKYIAYDTVITADDAANTVTFELPAPSFNFMGLVSNPVCAITDTDTTDWTNGTIGTGPYAIQSHVDLTSYTMVANPYYYEEVPYDGVEILFMGDASAKAMALQAGQVDLVENITNVSDIQSLQADPNYSVVITPGIRCGFSYMNQMEGRFLANDTIRQAVQMAVDHETVCNSATIGGLYTPGFSCLPSNLAYGYENLKDTYAFNPDAAMKLLDDAGIVDTDGDGIRELDGQNIVLKYVSYENRLLNDFSDAHTLYINAIGIGVQAAYGSSDDQWSSLVAGEYDLNNNNWTTVGTGDPSDYLANWYSRGSADYCGYVNAEYDDLYEEFRATADQAARAKLVEQMQQILIDDAALLVDGYYNSSICYNNATVGYAAIHSADYYWLSTEIKPAA